MGAARKKDPGEAGLQMEDIRHRQQARDALTELPAIVDRLRGHELAFAADALRMLTRLPLARSQK